jgi:hypothetical protein
MGGGSGSDTYGDLETKHAVGYAKVWRNGWRETLRNSVHVDITI